MLISSLACSFPLLLFFCSHLLIFSSCNIISDSNINILPHKLFVCFNCLLLKFVISQIDCCRPFMSIKPTKYVQLFLINLTLECQTSLDVLKLFLEYGRKHDHIIILMHIFYDCCKLSFAVIIKGTVWQILKY